MPSSTCGANASGTAETVYVGRLHAGASAEAATGWSIFVVAAAGAVVAVLALLSPGPGAARTPAPRSTAVSSRTSMAQ